MGFFLECKSCPWPLKLIMKVHKHQINHLQRSKSDIWSYLDQQKIMTFFLKIIQKFKYFGDSAEISVDMCLLGAYHKNFFFGKSVQSIYLSHSRLLFVFIRYKTSYLLENKHETNMSKNVSFYLDFWQNLRKKVTFLYKNGRARAGFICVTSIFITAKDHMYMYLFQKENVSLV